jgi:hypothetical protein
MQKYAYAAKEEIFSLSNAGVVACVCAKEEKPTALCMAASSDENLLCAFVLWSLQFDTSHFQKSDTAKIN